MKYLLHTASTALPAMTENETSLLWFVTLMGAVHCMRAKKKKKNAASDFLSESIFMQI